MKNCKQIATEWGLSERTVNDLCKKNKIDGAIKVGKMWKIPDDAKKPIDGRITSGKYVRHSAGVTRKPLPIGISDYVRAQADYYYVDKTMLIKEFLDQKPLVSLFTRPRRFGKTLNMDMLRVFFEISEENTSKYFEDKAIWQCGEEYRNQQGQYPVVFLTFKDVKFDSWKATLDKIRDLLQEEFGRHQELATSERIAEYEKTYFAKIINGDASEVDLTASLAKLSQMLTKHYGKAPIIIIDEYDTPIQEGYSKDFYDEIIGFMRNFFSGAFKDTQSPIVFIQQLGRGLRKAENKEYVVILDFIGNYNNNFMIPVALSGDRTYNADTIRKYVISGNNTIPGASTVHFDEIAKEKIFNSIDKIKGMRSIIKESYISLKNRIGRTPLLFDFYEQGEIDPLVIIREYKTYWQFMEAVEKGKYFSKLTDHEKLISEYLSKTILSGVRPSELFILQKLLTKKTFSVNEVQKELKRLLDYNITDLEMRESVKILQGCFTSKDEEYQKYKTIEIMDYDEKQGVRCFASYANCLLDNEFNTQVKDIINVGLARYRDKYAHGKVEQTPFVLYEKYSRRDVSLLMNCGKDMSSTMYGMSRIGDDVFIFITYHKEEAEEGKNYADGKPDYADAFEDNLIFKWDSQIGKDNSSPYMQKVLTAPRKHLLVKKSDAESSFYYMGQFDIIESVDSQKEDNSGKMKPIAKVTMKMHHPVREDLLRYLQSNISKENEAV